MNPLVLDGLTKNFGELQTLVGVNMTLTPGERRVILGPNGAGKTTLFHTISGVHPATRGTVTLFGQDVTKLSVQARARLGLGRTYQISNLFGELTVFENLFLGIQAQSPGKFTFLAPAVTRKKVVDEVEAAIELWDLKDVRDSQVKYLSYGQQRQIEVVLAMATKPKLLLLDEPTAGLSPAETASMTKFLGGLDRTITILMIEHDMDVAFEVADNITVLYFGRVLVEGPVAEVRGDSRVRDIYLGEPKWEGLI